MPLPCASVVAVRASVRSPQPHTIRNSPALRVSAVYGGHAPSSRRSASVRLEAHDTRGSDRQSPHVARPPGARSRRRRRAVHLQPLDRQVQRPTLAAQSPALPVLESRWRKRDKIRRDLGRGLDNGLLDRRGLLDRWQLVGLCSLPDDDRSTAINLQ